MTLTASQARNSSADKAGDLTMSDTEFQRVADRVFDMAGIVLESHKRQMIVSRLSRRLRARGIDDLTTYLDRLDNGKDQAELQEFLNTLTTNLTSFFRESHHFTHFEHNVLTPFKTQQRDKLRVWSAGCSSGEEPYSIALSALETLGRIPRDFKILATDLDTKMIDRGRAATYPAERVAGIDTRYGRHLKRQPEGETIKLPQAAQDAVSFRQLNLLQPWPMSGPFDVIFCRNVMIYFNAQTKAQLVDRFAQLLVPGGFLYLGHSESILGEHALLSNKGETTYQRVAR